MGDAAKVAGLPVGQLMMLLGEFGVRGRIDQEDYCLSLASLARVGLHSVIGQCWLPVNNEMLN
jgi:hypothetical protein